MFDKIIALFERLVIAHERLAASQESMLSNCLCNSTDLVDEIKEAVVEPPKEKKTRGKKKEEPTPEPAPVEEPVTPEVVEPEIKEVSHDEMKTAVKAYAVKHGTDKAKALIVEVGKAEKLADITDQDIINALYAAATEA